MGIFFPLKKDFKDYQVAPFQTESRNTRGCSCRRKVDKVESWSRGWREEAIFSILSKPEPIIDFLWTSAEGCSFWFQGNLDLLGRCHSLAM